MSVTVRFLPLILLMVITVPARGYDVLVSVTGNVIGNTCIVSEDSKEQNVPLGTLGVKQFSEAGAVSNIKTPFTLTLEACGPTFAGVKIRFSGTPDDENPQLLKVADGGATGVAVQILDKDSVLIPLDTQTAAYGAAGDDSVKMTFMRDWPPRVRRSMPETFRQWRPGRRSINNAFTVFSPVFHVLSGACPLLDIGYHPFANAHVVVRPGRLHRAWKDDRL